jgi:hypothetical protein
MSFTSTKLKETCMSPTCGDKNAGANRLASGSSCVADLRQATCEIGCRMDSPRTSLFLPFVLHYFRMLRNSHYEFCELEQAHDAQDPGDLDDPHHPSVACPGRGPDRVLVLNTFLHAAGRKLKSFTCNASCAEETHADLIMRMTKMCSPGLQFLRIS